MFLNLYLIVFKFVFKFVFTFVFKNVSNYLKLCKCVKHYLKVLQIVLIVIGVYINIYCSLLTFTNKRALGEITL